MTEPTVHLEAISKIDEEIENTRKALRALEQARLRQHALHDQCLLTTMMSAKSWSEARAAYEGTAFLLDKEYALTLLCMYSDRATLYVPSAASSVQEIYDLQAQMIRWLVPLLPTTMGSWGDRRSSQVKCLRLAQGNYSTVVVYFELKTGVFWLIKKGESNEVLMESPSVDALVRFIAEHYPYYN